MARPLWTGTLSFGLVSIPVEVHSAVRDLGPHFHWLREGDKSRIKYKKVAAKDDRPVDKDELVKGFEYEKGRYVVMEDKDFEKAALERSGSVDIIDFVDADEVDDRYFDKPYYLLARRGGEKAYALLREAIRKAGRVGVAKFVMRGRQHLAAVEAIDDALVLSTMRWREELVKLSEYKFPSAGGIRKQDLELAQTLVERLAATWEPDKYRDEYRENLLEIIRAKQKRQKPDLALDEEPQRAEVVDLMERLRRSLGTAAGARTRRAGKTKARRTATGRAAKGGSKTAAPRARRTSTKGRNRKNSPKRAA